MPTLCTYLAAAAGFGSLVCAADSAGPRVVGFDIAKRKRDVPASALVRRQKTVSADLTNEERVLYLINVTVGTPPQKIGLQIDTGSSDTWFPWTGATQCQQGECDSAFDPDSSSTFQDIGRNAFSIEYVDNTQVQGDYIQDTLRIGNTAITNLTMALATDTGDTPTGIMGVGFISSETLAQSDDKTYPNLPVQLVQQGLINSLSYSLWLNDLSASSGSILFGGVDSDKFHGDLIGLPIQPDSDSKEITSFTVALSSVNVTAGGGNTVYNKAGLDLPVILDSGTTLTLLPDQIANDIIQGVGAINSQELGYVVKCNIGQTGASINFGFGGTGGPTINVGLDEMVIPITSNSGRQLKFKNGDDACTFGIEPAGDRPLLLGDTFLRSAYVVYDLQNKQIALANTNFNATSSNVQEITNTTIPGVSAVASGLTVTQTATGAIRESGAATGTAGDATATAVAGSATFNLGSPTGTKGASKGAAASLPAPRIALQTVMCGVVVLLSAMFGGSLLVLL